MRIWLDTEFNGFGGDLISIGMIAEDVQHLCKFMITGPGYMITTPKSMQFTIDRSIESVSEVPHNALYDAIANFEYTIKVPI